jgi:hypothetical protein
VDQGDALPVVLDGVVEGGADEALGALLRDRLDADGAGRGKRIFFTFISFSRKAITFWASADSRPHSMPA